MKRLMTSLVAGATTLCLVNCTGKNNQQNLPEGAIVLDSSSIRNNRNMSAEQKAEELALAGEQLIGAASFMYADTVLEQALNYDSNNKRAQFYKAFLAAPMALRGILARIKPLATTTPEKRKEYEETLRNIPNSGLRSFLLDGEADMKSEKEIQGFLDDVYNGFNVYREFLKNNKSIEITLNVPEWAVKQKMTEAFEKCTVEQISEGYYVIQPCDVSRALQYQVNRADLEVLQQMAAGAQIYLAILTSYDASGALAVNCRFQNKPASNKTIYRELAKNPNFGKLRNAAALQNILSIGFDLIGGLRWAVEFQNELCPTGEVTDNVREGHLVEGSICIESENEEGQSIEDVFKTIELVLAGQAIQVFIGDSEDSKTEAKPAAIFMNPIADLKTLRPVYNSCDKIQSVSDDTIGGIFPNHDGNEYLAANARCYEYDFYPVFQK